MKVLALDPGHMTGIAVMNDNNLIMAISISYTHMMGTLLDSIVYVSKPDLIAVEGIPSQGGEPLTVELYHGLIRFLDDSGIKVITVPPGVWKPVIKNIDKSWSRHALDAIGLATYAIKHRGGE